MIVTIPIKTDKTVTIPISATTQVYAANANSLSLGQLKSVDISMAESGDVLMLVGTKWQAESLDGGEFN